MDMVYMFIVAIVVIILGTVGVYYLNKRGLLSKINYAKTFMKVAEILVNKYANQEVKEKFELINLVVRELVEYVEVIATYENYEQKHKFAFDTTLQILDKLGIKTDDNDKFLIDTAIQTFVKLLPPTYK